MKSQTYNKDGTVASWTDTTTTYYPHWTMDTIPEDAVVPKAVNRVTVDNTDLPGSDCEREVKPLPFFWWVNPWKHMELLFDAYKDHAETANAWRARYHQIDKLWTQDSAERDDQVEKLREHITKLTDEREAARFELKTLKKKGKRRASR